LGNPIVSRRRATKYVTPSINSAVNFNASNATARNESWVKLAFKVRRPIVSDNSITNSSRFIFAHSDSRPANADDINSDFPFHANSKGIFSPINFLGSKEWSEDADDDNEGTILIAHGILFFIAWGVAPFIGIFVARYLKNMLGVWWYRIHVGLFLGVTGLFSLISFILIVSNVESEHFDGKHQQIGLAVFIMMFLQIALGFVSNWLWSPTRTFIPWWDKVHWYFGRSLLILAIINIFLGILEYGEDISEQKLIGLEVTYWVWIGLASTVMILGQYYFGAQHHLETPKQNQEDRENAE
jgi:hypothetical protein